MGIEKVIYDKRLVTEAINMLCLRGYDHAVLWVLQGNFRARRFYETMGFELDGHFQTINWGTPLKAVRYSSNLKPRGVER